MQILQHLGSVCDDPTLLFTNVADKAHLIIDVVMVHEFHGACDDIGRQGALRHAQNPDHVLIDAAKRKVSNCSTGPRVRDRTAAIARSVLQLLTRRAAALEQRTAAPDLSMLR